MKNILSLVIILILYNCVHSQTNKILTGHTNVVNSVVFSNNGKYLYSGDNDGNFYVWNFKEGKIEKKIKLNKPIHRIYSGSNSNVVQLVFGKSGTGDFEYETLDLQNEKKFCKFIVTAEGYFSIPFNSFLSKSGMFYHLRNKKKTKGREGIYLKEMTNSIVYCNIKPTGCNATEEIIYDETYNFDLNKPNNSNFETNRILMIPSDVSSDENYIAFVTDYNHLFNYSSIYIYDIKNKYISSKFETDSHLKSKWVSIIKFHPTNKYIFIVPSYQIGSSDADEIHLYDIESKKIAKKYIGHEKRVLTMDIHPCGLYFASGSKDNNIIIWDINNNKKVITLKGHEDNINSVSFSNDGRFIVSSSDDEKIRVWDINNLTTEIKEFALKYDMDKGIDIIIKEEMENELKSLEFKYNPKGEFETTEAYNKRIEEANAEKKSIEDKYAIKLNEAKQQKSSELTGFNTQLQDEKQKRIDESVKDTILKIDKIGKYDADNQTFPVTITYMNENVKIPLVDAEGFKQNFAKAVVRSKKRLNNNLTDWEYFNIYIINPLNNIEYKFK